MTLARAGRLRQVVVGVLLGATVALPAVPELLTPEPTGSDPSASVAASAPAPAVPVLISGR